MRKPIKFYKDELAYGLGHIRKEGSLTVRHEMETIRGVSPYRNTRRKVRRLDGTTL